VVWALVLHDLRVVAWPLLELLLLVRVGTWLGLLGTSALVWVSALLSVELRVL
jgi:UPF0716 family protein affecting phage T7 exclusion